MKKENIGFSIIIISAILLILYGLFKSFQSIREFDLIASVLLLVFFVGLGYFTYIIMKEQRKDTKKKSKEIKKEDIEP